MKGIGARIRQLREGRDWSQRDFAKRLKLTQPAIAFWELGDDHPDGTKPSETNLYKVAKLFGVTPQYLLFGDEEDGKKPRRAA